MKKLRGHTEIRNPTRGVNTIRKREDGAKQNEMKNGVGCLRKETCAMHEC